jgi:hypothetical protein
MQTLLQDLASLVKEFKEVAVLSVKKIVAEMRLPIAERSIVPVDAGGVAGGEKFIHKGVFFKFTEAGPLYGNSYAEAAKAARREFRGLEAVLQAGVGSGAARVHTGLMLCVDWGGFCVLASVLLPISGKTLVYGSADAAARVEVTDSRVNQLMSAVASQLNLAPHFVGAGATRALVHGPADLEGHLGSDGRFYCCDSARIFPPLPPVRSIPGSHLTRLMRPALVITNASPISSDAFTMFGRDHYAFHNAVAREAASRLWKELIPRTALELVDMAASSCVSLHVAYRRSAFASNGVNIHLMGFVRKAVLELAKALDP